MRNFIQLAICLISTLTFVDVSAVPRSAVANDPTNGTGIVAWEMYDNTLGVYAIKAALMDETGTWGTATVISDVLHDCKKPVVAVAANGTGAAVVIWQGDSGIGNYWLCGTTYDYTLNQWNSPAILSDGTESVSSLEDYFVKISVGNDIAINYVSMDSTTNADLLRGIWSTYSTWGTPVTIDP